MKVGLVSQWYAPEPVFIAGNLADELAARGHEVKVLTAFPNYPNGRTYPGFRQRWRHVERSTGPTVRRVPIYPSHDASAARRAANLMSFAATSLAAAPRFLAGIDVVYVFSPPPTAYAAPALLRLLRGVPALLHVQDMWPESVTGSAMAPGGVAGRILGHGISGVMRRIYHSAAQIAVISPSMADLVIDRGADPSKVRVVWNWTDETLFRPAPATAGDLAAIGHRGRPVVMFAGNLGPLQRVSTAVRAAAVVGPVLDLVFVGSGNEEAEARQLAAELGVDNVRFLGRRTPQEMAGLYAAADFQLVTLRDMPGLRGTVPSKLQAALASGAPVIVSANGDCADLVAASGAGLASPAEDVTALAAQFRRAAALSEAARSAMSQRALAVYRERMSLRVGADHIEDMLLKMGRRGGKR
ncbi:glycosyltransferase family 4 protein [Micromonospora sp. KC721]|uniref:glycosyltransferase family 4 protein n=1 Tax=Micromonospora sp. KC721 TaxID=2530380 RepID=UPI001042DE1A|nr:glycosyltransferase family 4 protein [Micromonospora sp. KC721]TDB72534.1 glycosyltransferase WbuB [Micromonospora sp. KC721]